MHVLQWALVAQREPLGHAESAAHAARIMGEAAVLADGRRIGTGFRDALWPDSPTLEVLDAATGDVPTYLINADVHSVWLNTAALRREGHEPDGIGILREAPAFEISRRLNDVDPAVGDELVAAMATDAASRGVVGLVDLDMAWNESAWARRLGARASTRCGSSSAIYPEFLERAIAEGLRTGDAVRGAASDLARVGSLKVITDGSLGTRTAACSHAYPGDPHNHGVLDGRARRAARAHDRGDRRRAGVRDPRDRRRRQLPRARRLRPHRGGRHDRARAAGRARRHPAVRPARVSARACSPSTRSTTAT